LTRIVSKLLLGPCVLSLAACVDPGNADVTYPDKPVEILVGQGAGGSTDTVARTFAPFLGKYLDTPVVVRNMEGAGGRLMLRHLSSQPPDGYTLCLVTTPSYINVQLLREPRWDLRQLTYIQGVGGGDGNGLIVPYESQLASFSDVVEKAARGPMTVGSTAPGSNSWLLGVLLEEYAGDFQFEHVPFDSGMKATMAVAGGHVDLGLVSTVNIPELLAGKKIRVLAVSSKDRLSYLPDAPTFVELGYPDIVTTARMFLAAPPELPAPIRDILGEASGKADADPEFLALAEKQGFSVQRLSAEESGRMFQEEFERTEALLKAAGEID
jgi:tripartite-type tricarboxylate transporter receptor subunit TctC